MPDPVDPQVITPPDPETPNAVHAPGAQHPGANAGASPSTLSIIPATVELSPGERQEFRALGSAGPIDIVWTIAPTAGEFSGGIYTAPSKPGSTDKIAVIATSLADPTKTATASVVLKPAPMPFWAQALFGFGIFLFGCMVCWLAVDYWPLSDPDVKAATSAKTKADDDLKAKTTAAGSATQAASKAAADAAAHPADATLQAAATKSKDASTAANTARDLAKTDADTKAGALQTATEAATVNTLGAPKAMSREVNYLILALIMGALGSLIHLAKSFSGFAGNRTLVSSWAWWYVLQPMVGMTLALVVYVVVRGGFFATGAGSAAVNPFGIAAISGMVGMFSKQATNKLSEVFDVVFKIASDDNKDKMGQQPQAHQPPQQPAAPLPPAEKAAAAAAGAH